MNYLWIGKSKYKNTNIIIFKLYQEFSEFVILDYLIIKHRFILNLQIMNCTYFTLKDVPTILQLK